MKYYFDETVQMKIIKFLISDNRLDYINYLNPELFDGFELRQIFQYIKEKGMKDLVVPGFDLIKQECAGLYLPGDDVSEKKESVLQKVEEIRKLSIEPVEIKDIIKNFIISQESRKCWLKMSQEIELGMYNVDDWLKDLYRINCIRTDYKKGILLRNFEIESLPVRERIPTHLRKVNEWLKGGLAKGELGFVSGESSIGKTYFLLLLAIAACRVKRNVFYYSLELSSEQLYLRAATKLTGYTEEKIYEWPNKFRTQIEEKTKGIGELYIKDYPSKGETVSGIRSDIEMQKYELGIIPDMVIVDYCDIIKPMTFYGDDWEKLGDISSDLRKLATELDVAVWTASQIKTEWYGKTFTAQATGRSMQKYNIADVWIGLSGVYGEEYKSIIEQIPNLITNSDDEELMKVTLGKIRRAKRKNQWFYVKKVLSQSAMLELTEIDNSKIRLNKDDKKVGIF